MSCIIQPTRLQTAFATACSVLEQIGLQGPDTPLWCVDTDPAWRPDFLPLACWERTMAKACFRVSVCSAIPKVNRRGNVRNAVSLSSRKMCLWSPAMAAQTFQCHSVLPCADPSFLALAPDLVWPLHPEVSQLF